MRPKKYSISFVVETTMDQRTLLNAVHDYATNYLPELAVMVHDETLEPDERTVWVRCLSEDSKIKEE